MSREHLEFLQRYFPSMIEKTYLLRRFASPVQLKKEDSVQDPMGFGVEYYRKTRDIIENEIKRILPDLITLIDRYIESQGIVQ
jgi:hypothetical protein